MLLQINLYFERSVHAYLLFYLKHESKFCNKSLHGFFFETCSMGLNMKELRLNVHKNDLHFFFLKTKIFCKA